MDKKMTKKMAHRVDKFGNILSKIFPDPTRLFNENRPYHPILLMIFLIPVYSFVFGIIVPLKIHWVIITVIMASLMHLVLSYGHVWYVIVIIVLIDVIVNSLLMPKELIRS